MQPPPRTAKQSQANHDNGSSCLPAAKKEKKRSGGLFFRSAIPNWNPRFFLTATPCRQHSPPCDLTRSDKKKPFGRGAPLQCHKVTSDPPGASHADKRGRRGLTQGRFGLGTSPEFVQVIPRGPPCKQGKVAGNLRITSKPEGSPCLSPSPFSARHGSPKDLRNSHKAQCHMAGTTGQFGLGTSPNATTSQRVVV